MTDDNAQAIGERFRLLANDVPVATLRQVADWLADLQVAGLNLLGSGHPRAVDFGQAVAMRATEVQALIQSFTQLMTDIVTLGDQIAGRG